MALHKIGAILIPATHMLTVDDIVYRIEKAGISGIVCTTQDDTAKKMKEAVERTGGDIKLWTVQREFDGFSNLTEMLETASDEFERVKTCVCLLYTSMKNLKRLEQEHFALRYRRAIQRMAASCQVRLQLW